MVTPYGTLIFRFIPVYTGNTLLSGLSDANMAVYPCVYREHDFKLILNYPCFGLSLCIQGTQRYQLNQQQIERFIPVYTGNTRSPPDLLAKLTVYPCVYREHFKSPLRASCLAGLSLCIQGTRSS